MTTRKKEKMIFVSFRLKYVDVSKFNFTRNVYNKDQFLIANKNAKIISNNKSRRCWFISANFGHNFCVTRSKIESNFT